MTIKELEGRTGLTRANIRYYESEGLLDPKRLPNGYRDYSEEDACTLEKVRLLRELHLDIETIRLVQKGSLTLEQALFSLLNRLEADKTAIDRAARVCRELEQSGAEYDTLEPKPWLGKLEAPRYPSIAEPARPVSQKEGPVDYAHGCFWRRWLARSLDYALFSLPVYALFMLCLDWNPTTASGISEWAVSLLGLLLALLCEPFLLCFWGWTPGKWLLGLKVRGGSEGQRLTLGEGFARAGGVFFYGYGLTIPVVNLVCARKFWKRCGAEEPSPWDEENVYTAEKRPLGWLMWLGSMAAVLGLTVLLVQAAYLPPNRGSLTEREYYENINFYLNWMTDSEYRLTETGEWYEESEYPEVFVFHDRPEIRVEMGREGIRSVTLTSRGMGWGDVIQQDVWIYQVALLSLLAQEKISVPDYGEWTALFEEQWGSFEREYEGVCIVQTVDHTGYSGIGQVLVPGDGVAQSYQKTVAITLNGSE